MLFDFFFVDFDTESGARTGAHEAAFLLDFEAFADDIPTPRHVAVHGFADDIRRRREAELQGSGSTHGALRVVWRERHAIGFGHRRNTARFAESAGVRNIGLNHAA